MILDALTRAEHERQIEKQPDLNFVTPVKEKKTKSINVSVWVVGALLINALVLIFIFRPDSNPQEDTAVYVAPPQPQIESTPTIQTTSDENINSTEIAFNDVNNKKYNMNVEARPLEMEINDDVSATVDRPLIYESKSLNTTSIKQKQMNSDSTVSMSSQHGVVSFSDQELTVDDNTTQSISSTPKILIDQGQDDSLSLSSHSTTSIPLLKDLPESSRHDLSRYEVNVHVFDDNPERRFVLINMDKYKEGDRIANNGPLVEEITRKGVVIDYGNGRTLLPPK